GSYDILIDLYDAYDDNLAATISSDTNYELAEHYLEDITYENSTGSSTDFSIFSASLSLLSDNDNDGFYQSFSLQFDADVSSGKAYVYAEIWIRDSSGNWERDFVTEDYLLEGNSTLDTYILETVWESGYSTGYYDFRVEIYDADSFALVATSEAQDYELGAVPLEDASQDIIANSGGTGGSNNGGNTTSTSHGSGGGGSFGFALIILILVYSIRRTVMVRVKA
ncbi:MAG: putative membrane protein YgcG, partial [Enterobacterales bacterium]